MRTLPLGTVMLALAIGMASAPVHAQIPIEGSPLGSDTASSDYFGAAVALSGDTAIVGAPLNDANGMPNRGAAYVFHRADGVWLEEAKLIAPVGGGPSDQFGASVAIHGNIAVVGAPFDDLQKTDEGSAYIFTRTAANWTRSSKLVALDPTAGANFGAAVAIYEHWVLVGAPNKTIDGRAAQGAVYVFDLITGAQTKLTSFNGAAADRFGQSVALQGNTAVIGAPGKDVARNTDQGAAYVFDLITGARTQLTSFNGAAAGDRFGQSVALQGNTAVIGAPGKDVAGNTDQGAAYVFDLSTGTPTALTQLTSPSGAAGGKFGSSVAVSGNAILVGAYGEGTGGNRGSAHLFETPPWSDSKVVSGATANSYTGWAVALSGTTLAVGAPLAQSIGRVDVFNAAVPSSTGTPASVDLTSSPTAVVYSRHIVTATARHADQQPAAGALVIFTGHFGDARCYTTTAGTCSITMGGPAFPVDDVVTACTSDGTISGTICDTTSIDWVLPASTSGASGGGGQVMPLGSVASEVSFSPIFFAFNADDNGSKCHVTDDSNDVTGRCDDGVTYVQGGPHAFFYGFGLVNGVSQFYRVDVNDGGQSADAVHTLTLVTTGGYALAGAVVKGHLQVR